MQVILDIDDGSCTQEDDCKDSGEMPGARFAHAACVAQVDSTQRMYMFGGMGKEKDLQDVLSWTPGGGKEIANF